jgi:16S rRNA C967 or C1407 C5-methylase (RsmB/RsmF family)
MIAQDKASCFPALVLDPPALDSACVIDATAAPGNKVGSLIMCTLLDLPRLYRRHILAH